MKDIRTQWKALAAKKEITAADIAALCLYRTLYKDESSSEAKSRLHKSFTPIINQTKLNNGAQPYFALENAMYAIRNSAILTWVDDEDRTKILELAKATMQAGLK